MPRPAATARQPRRTTRRVRIVTGQRAVKPEDRPRSHPPPAMALHRRASTTAMTQSVFFSGGQVRDAARRRRPPFVVVLEVLWGRSWCLRRPDRPLPCMWSINPLANYWTTSTADNVEVADLFATVTGYECVSCEE